MNVAVVGHVEWIEFLRVDAVPKPGEIVGTNEWWGEAAGGGGVAAAELARLLGGDELGARSRSQLEAAGVRVHSPQHEAPQRRGYCYLDEVGERTITVIGEKPRPHGGDGTLPWEELDRVDGVYFTAGDAEAVRQARRARVLIATARELPTLHAAGVELDALVASGDDDAERYQAGDLDPPRRLDGRRARRLGPARRAVQGDGGSRSLRGRLRRGRLLRGRAHVRARAGDGSPGRALLRLGARCAGAHPPRRRPHRLSPVLRSAAVLARKGDLDARG